GCRRHDQPPAARRPHGVRALAGRDLDRAPAEGPGVAEAGAVGVDAEHRRVVGAGKRDRGAVVEGAMSRQPVSRKTTRKLPVSTADSFESTSTTRLRPSLFA